MEGQASDALHLSGLGVANGLEWQPAKDWSMQTEQGFKHQDDFNSLSESLEPWNQFLYPFDGNGNMHSTGLVLEDGLVPQALANLCSNGNEQLKNYKKEIQETGNQGKMDKGNSGLPAEPTNHGIDVEGMLADLRGLIGQSLAQENGGSVAPSTSQPADDDSVDYSEDAEAATKKPRRGLPPPCPKSDSVAEVEIPEGLSVEDQKRLKRRISNRECARRIRQRRQEQLVTLSTKIDSLRAENANLMTRLTEVMKCWHDISKENRLLKAKMISIRQKKKGTRIQNGQFGQHRGDGPSDQSSQVDSIVKSLGWKAPEGLTELLNSICGSDISMDAIRSVLGNVAGEGSSNLGDLTMARQNSSNVAMQGRRAGGYAVPREALEAGNMF
uniref:BZIP domain-containing protein n=1 Tax=Tetraselmis sp. GSL018 TaxID=582737 RepID=A0A061S9C8_9CHLO|mmetsp:Transcript_839/g.2022  ORF Transcript_839/g.2022 Transcript_839/m.2022 type:complete len:385 (-) Transcript_839:462-1616(-)|eukprot:CAMPEP_0177599216 /NCGR_PEP_ID=MMETSP0419_2-20121207/12850_1 /TAXON_ID=582737 /ORGANISM="Tetraselmis sp., Strain GSL018" /LENGTH=384 /DNA_ID=CAMNT_0019091885 /DNA_START=66 /DNA_END=1220 /DNA_ORIENTATION=-